MPSMNVSMYVELADKMLAECEAGFHPVTNDDREALTELIERLAGELGEFLAGIRARPVNGMPENPHNVIAREAQERRRRRRLLTGSNGK